MIRVFVADDRPVVLRGLESIVEAAEGFELCGFSGNPADAATEPGLSRCDVAIVGGAALNGEKQSVIARIRSAAPGVHVLTLTPPLDGAVVVTLLRAGADGCISTTAAEAEILEALRITHEGRTYVEPAVQAELLSRRGAAPRALSARELAVLIRIARGASLQKIADSMSLRRSTVATYRSRILQKLSLDSNAQLTAYALRHHLLGD